MRDRVVVGRSGSCKDPRFGYEELCASAGYVP
jgi:hypothetical protein